MPPVTRWFIPHIIKSEFSTIWKLSLLSFIIAALTGVLYRYGFLGVPSSSNSLYIKIKDSLKLLLNN